MLDLMDCFSKSQQSVPNTLRTAVRYTTLGVYLTDVRRDEVKRRLTKKNNHQVLHHSVEVNNYGRERICIKMGK